MKSGPGALPDYEMLELLLFQAQPRRDMKALAKRLLKKFGSFSATISAEPADCHLNRSTQLKLQIFPPAFQTPASYVVVR